MSGTFSFLHRSPVACALLALMAGAATAQAQTAPVSYWLPNWPAGFSGEASEQAPLAWGDVPAFDASGRRGSFQTRYSFPNGWFIGSQRNDLASGLRAINPLTSYGGLGFATTDSVRFGYDFKNAPVSFFAGVDALKFERPTAGALSAFDTRSTSTPAYGINAGVEFRPTSNLSLSFGVGFTQQQGGMVDSDINSPALPGTPNLAIGRR